MVIGYLDQQVKVDDAIPVELHEADSPLAACGYSLPYNGGGCDTEVLLANAEAIVRHPVSQGGGRASVGTCTRRGRWPGGRASRRHASAEPSALVASAPE